MPCNDGYPLETTVYRTPPEVQKRLDITTRLACEYCKLIESKDLPIPEWAQEWWTKHKKIDAQKRNDKGQFTKE